MASAAPPSSDASPQAAVLHWLVALVVIVGALVNAAVGVLSLISPADFLALVGHRGEQVTAGTEIYAAYTGARDLAIAVALLVLLAMRSTRVLPGLMLVVASANAVDGADALVGGRWAQVPGAFAFAILFLLAAIWLFRHAGRPGAA